MFILGSQESLSDIVGEVKLEWTIALAGDTMLLRLRSIGLLSLARLAVVTQCSYLLLFWAPTPAAPYAAVQLKVLKRLDSCRCSALTAES